MPLTTQKFAQKWGNMFLLNGEIFYSLKEAQVIIEKWRVHYNTRRPHSALSYKPPAPLTITQAPAPLDQAYNQ